DSRTATTLTSGAIGTYSIPGLPLLTPPAAYTLTASGAGYTTQTQTVQLTTGDKRQDIEISHDTATINGSVVRAKDGGPIEGAGVVLESDTVVRKTTTLGDGSYIISAVPAGEYVVTFEKFGFVSQSVLVDAVVGSTKPAPEARLVADTAGVGLHANARIEGVV